MSVESRNGSSPRRLVLVVGIGRSGTSLFAGILGGLGFSVPQPEVKADDTNPRGFSEPRWVVDFHTRLMRERRVTVFDARPAAWESTAEAEDDDAAFEDLRAWLAVQFVGTDSVVVKDPRIGWFLPLWRRCAEDLGLELSFATMLRQPPEVVRSASQWYGTWQEDASRAAAWLNVTLHTELATRGARRAFVRYDDLLEDWSREIARVGRQLHVPWLAGLERASHPEVDAFVDPGLRRATVGWDEVAVPAVLRDQVDRVWELVSALAGSDGDDEATLAALDEARAGYVRLYRDAEAIAQSSVTAVKPRSGGTGLAAAAAARLERGNGRKSPRGLVVRVLPAKRSGARGDPSPLPVRIALLIPHRVRERVPLPVVRAGLRLLGSRRHL